MSTGLLTAGSGQGWENELVAALDRPGSPMTVLRRCADIGDVLAVATTGQAAVAVVSADLRRLDTEAVRSLRAAGVAIVGVHPSADQRARVRLERIGITALVPDDAGSDAVVQAARLALAELDDGRGPDSARSLSDPRRALPPRTIDTDTDTDTALEPPPKGRVVAVWGPTGAPGRTTVATGLATESARTGVPTLLIDADVYGGVVASAFGLLDESPGLAGACRTAANGRLDLEGLTALCWSMENDLRVLTGISRSDRWPEVRPSAIPLVLAVAREMAPSDDRGLRLRVGGRRGDHLRHHGAAAQRCDARGARRRRHRAGGGVERSARGGAADPRTDRARGGDARGDRPDRAQPMPTGRRVR